MNLLRRVRKRIAGCRRDRYHTLSRAEPCRSAPLRAYRDRRILVGVGEVTLEVVPARATFSLPPKAQIGEFAVIRSNSNGRSLSYLRSQSVCPREGTECDCKATLRCGRYLTGTKGWSPPVPRASRFSFRMTSESRLPSHTRAPARTAPPLAVMPRIRVPRHLCYGSAAHEHSSTRHLSTGCAAGQPCVGQMHCIAYSSADGP